MVSAAAPPGSSSAARAPLLAGAHGEGGRGARYRPGRHHVQDRDGITMGYMLILMP